MDTTTTRTAATVAAVIWRLLLVLALTTGISGLAAGQAFASGADDSYVAAVAGTITPTGEATFELDGAGGGLRLGPVDYDAQVQITSVDPATGTITDVLTETFTTRRGDTLTILCHQVATEISPGVYVGTDSWTVVGGTGRFEGATGQGSGQTHVDLGAGTFTKALVGEVSR